MKLKKNLLSVSAESNRVPLPYMDGLEDSDYINAVFVHVRESYKCSVAISYAQDRTRL